MIFEDNFKIGLADLNANVELRNYSLLKLLEDVAGYHSDSVHRGINDNYGSGTAWALLDWEVDVTKRPKYGQKIRITTWPRLMNKCHVYRDFEIYADGEKCAIATTKWMLMDLKRRWPVIIKPELMQEYAPEIGRSVFGVEELARLPEVTGAVLTAEYKVRRSDIDINGHVHNLNYLNIVEEALSEEETIDVNHFRISYKKEIRPGETVKIFRQDEETVKENAKNGRKITLLIKNEEGSEVHAIITLQ